MSVSERGTERRSGEQSRAMLLAAARQLFRERGFGSTGTRDIASAAGVPEKLIFRHYGGKAELFDAAARAQIEEFIDAFFESWTTRRPDTYSLDGLTREFIAAFLDFAESNRQILIDLINLHGTGSAAPASAAMSPFVGLFTKMEELASTEAARHGLRTDRAGRDVRFTFGTVVSAVLLSDVLYSESYPRPPRETLVGQLSDYVLSGTLPERVADS
jgi:AcrR family transcriptional regulator